VKKYPPTTRTSISFKLHVTIPHGYWNGIVHKGEEATARKALQQNIERALDEGPSTVLREDRHFFAQPRRVRTAQPNYQRAWLQSVKVAQQRERRLMTRESQRQIMRAWLETTLTQ